MMNRSPAARKHPAIAALVTFLLVLSLLLSLTACGYSDNGAVSTGKQPTADDTPGGQPSEDPTADPEEKDPLVYKLLSDNQAGKSYYADTENRDVTVSVVPYSWMSAKDMAESKRGAGISKVVDEGRYEVNGVIYYYYAYSVLHIKGEKRSCTYHFAAYADLKNGDIYVIYGDADDNPQAMDPQSYYDLMDIKEECYP